MSCLHNDPVVTAFNVLYRVLDEAHDHRDLFAKDVWSAREIGIHTNGTNGTQRVIFTGIRQRWLKDAATENREIAGAPKWPPMSSQEPPPAAGYFAIIR